MAMCFLNEFLESHGDAIADSFAAHLQLDREGAERMVRKTVPLVLGGLLHRARAKGPESVAQILEEHGPETALTDTQAFLDQQAQSTDPLAGFGSLIGGGGGLMKGALGGLFGGAISGLVTRALTGFLDVEPPQAAKVLPMLVPLIMATLHRRAADAESGGWDAVMSLLEAEGDVAALEELASKILGGGR